MQVSSGWRGSRPERTFPAMGRLNAAHRIVTGASLGVWAMAAAPTAAGAVGTWITDANGRWSNPMNWSGEVPRSPGDVAVLGAVISQNRTIEVDRAFSIQGLTF